MSGGLSVSSVNRAISSLLHSVGTATGNDPADISAVGVHNYEQLAIDDSNRLASYFLICRPAGIERNLLRVQKHAGRIFERNAVFGEVARRLGVVPFERASARHWRLYGDSAVSSTEFPDGPGEILWNLWNNATCNAVDKPTSADLRPVLIRPTRQRRHAVGSPGARRVSWLGLAWQAGSSHNSTSPNCPRPQPGPTIPQ